MVAVVQWRPTSPSIWKTKRFHFQAPILHNLLLPIWLLQYTQLCSNTERLNFKTDDCNSRIITDPKIAAPTAVPTVDITVTAVHTVTAPEAVTCTPFIDVTAPTKPERASLRSIITAAAGPRVTLNKTRPTYYDRKKTSSSLGNGNMLVNSSHLLCVFDCAARMWNTLQFAIYHAAIGFWK